jgi:hypothetical protein
MLKARLIEAIRARIVITMLFIEDLLFTSL